MASPVQIGDIIAILNAVYQAYDAYRSTPDELTQALSRFERAKNECEALNQTLSRSRRQSHRRWPGTDDFLADLQSAHDFFKQFKPLLDIGSTNKLNRIRSTVSARWNAAKVKYHADRIEMHCNSMQNFKQTVVIEMAQDTVELQLQSIRLQLEQSQANVRMHQSHIRDDASSIMSDRMSTLTRVKRSLKAARQLQLEPAPERPTGLSPVLEAGSASLRSQPMDSSNELRHRIVERIERAHLYDADSVETITIQDLEYIARLPERWLQRQREQQVQAQRHMISPPSGHLAPLSPRETMHLADPGLGLSILEPGPVSSTISPRLEDTQSLSPSWNLAFDRAQFGGFTDAGSSASTRILGDPALDFEKMTFDDGASLHLTQSEEQHDVVEGVLLRTPFDKQFPVKLDLKLTQGSLHVQATTEEMFSLDSLPILAKMTPSTVLRLGRHGDAEDSQERQPLIFHHAIEPGMRSFPRVLHPRAQDPRSAYPYVIEFYEHQYFTSELYPKLPKAVMGLSYHFKDKKARNTVREAMFGKELLASVAVDNIQFDNGSKPKPCGTQVSTLWKSGSKISITVQCSTKGEPAPDCAVELKITGVDMKELEKVRGSTGKGINLKVRKIEHEATNQASPTLSAGVLSSSSTTRSAFSGVSDSSNSTTDGQTSLGSQSRKSSWAFSPSLKSSKMSIMTTKSARTVKAVSSFYCFIRFTESNDKFIRAKKDFLDALKRNIGIDG